MDQSIFPPPTPAPLILPRRVSFAGGSLKSRQRQQQSSPTKERSQDDISLGGSEYTHCYYYPTSVSPALPGQARGIVGRHNLSSSSPNPLPIFSFGTSRSQDGFITAASYDPARGSEVARVLETTITTSTLTTTNQGPSIATIGGQTRRRRHSVASGSPWTTVPPKHALHMPIMKINPEIWRSETHQREIHRLMHEGRQEEIMRRRDMKSVMDTSEEGDDDEDEIEMSDVVMTMDLGGFRALEEREKERIQAEVRREWMNTLGHSQDPFRRGILPNQMQQQQLQQAQLQAVRGASYQGGLTTGGTGGGGGVQLPNQVPHTGLQQLPLYSSTSSGGWASTVPGFSQSPDYPRRASFTAYRG